MKNPLKFRAYQMHDQPHVRYETGLLLADEILCQGRWVNRYLSATGMTIPEHLIDLNDPLFVTRHSAFRIEVGGVEATNFSFVAFGPCVDESGLHGSALAWEVVLEAGNLPLRVRIVTRLCGDELMVRSLVLENTGKNPLPLTGVTPLSGCLWRHTYQRPWYAYERKEVIPDKQNSQFSLVHTHRDDWTYEGDFWESPLAPGHTWLGSQQGRSGWGRPTFWAKNCVTGELFACEFAYGGNWQVHFHNDSQLSRASLMFQVGLFAPQGEVLRVLDPGERLVTPAVHFGLFHDENQTTQALHRHVRGCVIPPMPRGLLEIECCHRGYLSDNETPERLCADADVYHAVGVEHYMVDAGWYGDLPNDWTANAGDWFEGEWLPEGLEPFAHYIREKGMSFGLWVEIEAIGSSTRLRKNHPHWSMMRLGQPIQDGRALDLVQDDAYDWALSTLCGLVDRLHLATLRNDHNRTIDLGGTRLYQGYTENTLWRYYDRFYSLFSKVRARYPNLVLQNCAGGGGRLDYATLSLFHCTEITDWERSPRDIRIMNGIFATLPPEICLTACGAACPDMLTDADINFALRKSMMGKMILRGISPSLIVANQSLLRKTEEYVQLYKEFMRPLLAESVLVRHTGHQAVAESAEHTVLEYGTPKGDRAAVFAFRTSPTAPESYTLYPQCLSGDLAYEIRMLQCGLRATVCGWELIQRGVRIPFPSGCIGSEMILFQAINPRSSLEDV